MKKMTDIKFIFHPCSPLTIYKQNHKGHVKLTIDVHGRPYKSGQGGLEVGDTLFSPGMLLDWLTKVVDLKETCFMFFCLWWRWQFCLPSVQTFA